MSVAVSIDGPPLDEDDILLLPRSSPAQIHRSPNFTCVLALKKFFTIAINEKDFFVRSERATIQSNWWNWRARTVVYKGDQQGILI
jgi:hypothetical protein